MCFIANFFIVSKLAKILRTQKLLCILLFSSSFVVFLIIVPTKFNWIWVTYGLAVIPTIMSLTVCTTWLSNQVKYNEQGQVLGNNQALLVMGEASSAAAGGLIAAISVPLPIILTAIILLFSSFMVWKTVGLVSD